LLFGGGFHIVHEVKVQNLSSSTNFIGAILLFATMSIALHLHLFGKTGRFIALFVGIFLSTAAKGSIGACLFLGIIFWICFRAWKKSITATDITDGLGGLIGFLFSYFLFFVWPTWGQEFGGSHIGQWGFPLIPLTYVTKNDLFGPLVGLLYKYLPGIFPIVAHIIFTIAVLPIYILLYYSYRLLVPYDFSVNGASEKQIRIFLVVLGSLFLGYLINSGTWQNHAYFITSAVFLLDVLFVFYAKKEGLFSKIFQSFKERNIFTCTGALVISVLPFITVPGWIRGEHTHNLLMFGRIGQILDSRLKETSYRKAHRFITPELYDVLQFIKESTDKDVVIVTPLLKVPNGKPGAFVTSTFSERTSFVEGYYAWKGVNLYADQSELEERLQMVEAIYRQYKVPERLQHGKYLFLVRSGDEEEFIKRYVIQVLYENREWSVLQIQREKG
jgi:hypothetical protein